MKKFVFFVVMFLIMGVTTIAGGEVMIRVYDHLKGVTPPYTHNMPECIAIPNGYFNFDLQPNLSIMYDSRRPRKFSFNRWGFRAPDYDPIKPEGVYRIFNFGGSSTFDPYVSDEETWSALVGTKLAEKTGGRIESINAGRYGYMTSEILNLFYHRALRHDPDLIIIYSTFNDAHTELSPYYSRDDGPQLYGSPLLSWLNKHSALFAYFDFRLRSIWPTQTWYRKVFPAHIYLKEVPPEHKKYVSDPQRASDYVVEIYKRNLRAIVMIARDNGVKVLFSTQLIAPKNNIWQKKAVTQAMRDVAAEMKVPILDLDTPDVDPVKEELLVTYVHLSPKGCDYVADKMVDAIITSGLYDK